MKMAKKFIIAVATVLTFCMMSPSVWAGSKQQHLWEGVAIGVGAAIVGSTLINHHAIGYHSGPPVAFSFRYRDNHRYDTRHQGYGMPHDGRPQNHLRKSFRGNHYQDHRRHGDSYSHRYKGGWNANERGNHGNSQKRHNIDSGGQRYR